MFLVIIIVLGILTLVAPPYLALGRQFALSDADRLFRAAHKQLEGSATNMKPQERRDLEDALYRSLYFKTLFLWPIFWAHNRLLHGLQQTADSHPLRVAEVNKELEAADEKQARLELEAAKKDARERELDLQEEEAKNARAKRRREEESLREWKYSLSQAKSQHVKHSRMVKAVESDIVPNDRSWPRNWDGDVYQVYMMWLMKSLNDARIDHIVELSQNGKIVRLHPLTQDGEFLTLPMLNEYGEAALSLKTE